MTLAQALLLPITALMLVDYRLTCFGIGTRGLVETNTVADRMITRLGLECGLALYQAAVFAIFSSAAVLFPTQWAFQVMLLLDVGICVAGNVRLLNSTGKQ